VTATGQKTFYRVGRINGSPPVRIRIGEFPDLSVEQARKACQKLAGQIAEGQNPHQERQAMKAEKTLGAMFEWFLENHSKPRKRTWPEDERLFNKFLATWGNRRLSAISRTDVQALHAKVGRESGPYQANRVLALLRAVFNKAGLLGFEGKNPVVGVEPFREQSRDRFLLPEELPTFFEALKAEPQDAQDFVMLSVLIGARAGNLAAMAWQDLHLDLCTWRIPDTKSKKPAFVHLCGKAIEILNRRQANANGSLWVFPPAGRANAHHPAEACLGPNTGSRRNAGFADA